MVFQVLDTLAARAKHFVLAPLPARCAAVGIRAAPGNPRRRGGHGAAAFILLDGTGAIGEGARSLLWHDELSMVDAAGSPTFVLTVDAVKWAIATLGKRKIHPHFLAYLQVHRRWTYDGQFDPQWSELRPLLEMPGGPLKKPNYRPLWNRDSDGSAYWFNDNLAGSFATSSIRRTAGFLVDGETYVLPEDHAARALDALLYGHRAPVVPLSVYLFRNFGFRISGASAPANPDPSARDLHRLQASGHAEEQRRRQLGPGFIARFPMPTEVEDGWRRNEGGPDLGDSLPEPEDVVAAFRRRFQFGDDEEFEGLFDSSAPSVDFPWFEPLLEEQVE